MTTNTITIILGDMLFEDVTPLQLSEKSHVFMCEDYKLCTHYLYHKQKILFFLSSMRSYKQFLEQYCTVEYHMLEKETSFFERLEDTITKKSITHIQTYEINDKFFRNEIIQFCKKHNIILDIIKTQSFLFKNSFFTEIFEGKKRFLMQDFYVKARQKTGILMDGDKPIGGKWHYDYDNRKKIPKNYPIAKEPKISMTIRTKELIPLVEKIFDKHPGTLDFFNYPTTHKDAKKWLEIFFEERFSDFGPYEDAMKQGESLLFHSKISPLINCGLLTPQYVIDEAIKTQAPIQSVEGFIRQILGWREFMKAMYERLDFLQNSLNHTNRLSQSWYDASTGIEPLDDCISKALKFAYNHHIERLMVIGNIMLLCRVHPDDVNKWFMELFIDSADWVMVPNVYAMSQFAIDDMTTKPYICGSNYILKMSDYKKGKWCDILDGLYWKFIEFHKELFAKNHRMSFMVKNVEKMDSERKKYIYSLADEFIKKNTC